MIVAINYADEKFLKSQKFNTKTAYKKGKVDKVIEYSRNDIDEVFYKKNSEILNKERGGGYWLWKPYFINKTINEMNDGDYLFYSDSGSFYIDKVTYLIKSMEDANEEIMVFDLPLIEKQWTKPLAFKIMDLDDDKYKDSNQRLATYILFKVSDKSRKFIKEYLELCTNENLLVDSTAEVVTESFFKAHRHDQSILSLLSKKYDINSFRDPSQYGIRPWEYMANGRMYNELVYNNSKYPQILVSQRKSNINSFRIKEWIKRKLTVLGILNKNQFINKNNIKLEGNEE